MKKKKNKIEEKKQENEFELSMSNQIHNSQEIKIRFLQLSNQNISEIKELSGLLKLLLIKKLSNIFNNINNSYARLGDLKEIFMTFKHNIHLVGDKNIQSFINENSIMNLFFYSQCLSKITTQHINKLIKKFLNPVKTKEFENYWKCLTKYIEYNKFFESQLIKNLKKCKFDYSLISINILEIDKPEEYEQCKIKCPNAIKQILYHSTKIKPNSKMDIEWLQYSKKSLTGKGFYFSDNLDYIACFSNFEKNENYGKILPVNSTFSCIISEIFYDKNKQRILKDINLSENNLINIDYQYKNVEPNGINIEKKEIEKNLGTSTPKKGDNICMGNEYVISEKNQIFPFYALTFKRNEYYVLWRDPNFTDNNEYTKYLEELKELYFEKTNMNFYLESSTEEALKFLMRRKYEKVILVTSIGRDLSGKRFIEIARKILNSDIIVLFFSNNTDHFEWLTKFPNCLYTNKFDLFEEYITNFNEEGLKNLKKKVENTYNQKLRPFSFDFLIYKNYKDEGDFSSLDFKSYYIKRVHIKNENNYLCMTKEAKVIISEEKCDWDITIFDNEITLFSNGFYLDLDSNHEDVKGFKYMKRWIFDKINEDYYFMNPEKEQNNILSIKEKEIKVKMADVGKTEKFELIEVLEE